MRSIFVVWAKVTTGKPNSAASFSEWTLVGTARMSRNLPARTANPTASMKNRAVEPVPRPMIIPFLTCSSADSPARCFGSIPGGYARRGGCTKPRDQSLAFHGRLKPGWPTGKKFAVMPLVLEMPSW